MDEKKNIGGLFDRIAGSYDRLNHLLSAGVDRRWRRKAVAGMKNHGEVLDVAIGTADLAIELVRAGRAQKVTGIDLSEGMMQLGRQKVEKRNMQDRIRFMQASALDMPLADGSFDAVTCAYGVRNFQDAAQGLREMARVMRPGGELMILEFSYPDNRLVAWLYDLYFSHVLPRVGRWLSRDKTAYTYLNKSVKNFMWGEAMMNCLREAGFAQVSCKTLTLGITTIYRGTKSQPDFVK